MASRKTWSASPLLVGAESAAIRPGRSATPSSIMAYHPAQRLPAGGSQQPQPTPPTAAENPGPTTTGSVLTLQRAAVWPI